MSKKLGSVELIMCSFAGLIGLGLAVYFSGEKQTTSIKGDSVDRPAQYIFPVDSDSSEKVFELEKHSFEAVYGEKSWPLTVPRIFIAVRPECRIVANHRGKTYCLTDSPSKGEYDPIDDGLFVVDGLLKRALDNGMTHQYAITFGSDLLTGIMQKTNCYDSVSGRIR